MMEFDEFREQGHKLVDWMADYLESVERNPVRSQVQPGDITKQLPSCAPSRPEAFDDIFRDFQDVIMPGMTHWQHPSFFAFFTANSSPPSVLAEMLTATVGAQCMLWETSPAATELETRVLDWLRQMCGLPGPDEGGFHGVIQDTASSAILCAILTAREQASQWQSNQTGLADSMQLAVYTSRETHSSTEKAVKIAGLGKSQLRKIETDSEFALLPTALEKAIEQDVANGIVPACVVASVGATGVGAIDPLRAIGEICNRYGVFLHVDAAWAGNALILPECRWMIDGIEFVDSLVLNPHKWLMTNFDCSAHFVRDPGALVRTLSILPEYLRHANQDSVIDYRDWGIALGRRFRALKLWFVIRSYGTEQLQEILREHIALAQWLEEQIEKSDGFELTSPRRLSLLTFRHAPAGETEEALNERNGKLVASLNESGKLYVTGTTIGQRYVIRLNIGQTYTKRMHVEQAWDLVQTMASPNG
ncbi:MAG: aspartate aminotransferase family protein [Aureliella sp.]